MKYYGIILGHVVGILQTKDRINFPVDCDYKVEFVKLLECLTNEFENKLFTFCE